MVTSGLGGLGAGGKWVWLQKGNIWGPVVQKIFCTWTGSMSISRYSGCDISYGLARWHHGEEQRGQYMGSKKERGHMESLCIISYNCV